MRARARACQRRRRRALLLILLLRASTAPYSLPLRPPHRSTDVVYPVRFYGSVSTVTGADGKVRRVWSGGETVVAIAYDNPIPGYDTFNTINLRLFRAAPCREFDLASFNTGDVRAPPPYPPSRRACCCRARSRATAAAVTHPCPPPRPPPAGAPAARSTRAPLSSGSAPRRSPRCCTPLTRRLAARSCG